MTTTQKWNETYAASPSAQDEQDAAAAKAQRMQANLAKMQELSGRLTAALGQRRAHDTALDGPSQEIYIKAASAYIAQMMQNPAKILEHQIGYWGKTLTHYIEAQQTLARGAFSAPKDMGPKDRRFSNPLWESHPVFNFIKQQYQMNANALTTAIGDMETLDPSDRKRVEYFTKQVVDLFAPTNFLGTNPDALEKAIATDGESLVKGLENLIRDLEDNQGEMLVTLADKEAFQIGGNIATSAGAVVYRNRMFELIQYRPTTEKVHKTPLLIFPPWINKFYIMDLKPQNSLIKWIVDQGFTVFVVSWVNPDSSYSDTAMDDYIREGFLRAMAEVRRLTDEPQINAVGYCIAGTTLSLTLAHLENQGDTSVKSATLFTTLTDFSDTGEFGVFLTDDFIDGIQRQAEVDGVLSKLFMQRTFSYMRSNELIYQPAIRSYMLGEAPPAFDLLFWNGDATNLPARMAVEYLRGLCMKDGFARGVYPVFGKPVSLKDVKVPLCAVACETDHIAPWKASFNGVKQMGSKNKTFILSQSGHIAGIINPPSKGKYGHYTNSAKLDGGPDDWLKAAEFNEGSWWPRWGAWLAKNSGPKVAARQPGNGPDGILAAAPGLYVTARPVIGGQ